MSASISALANTSSLSDPDDPAGVPPSPAGRALLGPMTTWAPGGQLTSHGSYKLAGDHSSLPDGLWTFWHDNGRVRSRGNYADGMRVGCFSLWDEDGNRRSALWSDDKQGFEEVACKGPTSDSLLELEDQLRDTRSDTVQLDVTLGTLFSRGGFGIKNQSYVVREPGLSNNLELEVRRHLHSFRLGGLISRRTSDDGGHDAWVAAATVALSLPSPHDRLALDVSLGLGAQRTEAQLVLRDDPSFRSDSPLTFLGLYAAAEIEAAIRAHKNLEFVIAGRAEGGLPGTWETTKVFRSPTEAPIRQTETWQVGRYSLGLGLGMRVSFY